MNKLSVYFMLGIIMLLSNTIAMAKEAVLIYEQSYVTKTGIIDSGSFFSNSEGQVAADQFTLPHGCEY